MPIPAFVRQFPKVIVRHGQLWPLRGGENKVSFLETEYSPGALSGIVTSDFLIPTGFLNDFPESRLALI